MKRTAIRRVSAKRAASFMARSECVDAVIRRDRVCQYPLRTAAWFVAHGLPLESRIPSACSGPLVVHEPGKRSHGADPTDPSQAVLLCSGHHSAVHANPAIGEVLGLLYRNGKPVEAAL